MLPRCLRICVVIEGLVTKEITESNMPIVKTKLRNCKNANHMEKAKLYDTENKMYSNLTGDKSMKTT